MLPLGLVLFAQDVPILQKPLAHMLGLFECKLVGLERAKSSSECRAKNNK